MLDKLVEYLATREKRKLLELERRMVLDDRQHELDLKKMDLEEKLLNSDNFADDRLDRLSMEQMEKGWKDEFILLILFFPLIVSFIPVIQDATMKGFEIMKTVPDWYMYLIVAIVVVVYGLRNMLKFIISHKAANKSKVKKQNSKESHFHDVKKISVIEQTDEKQADK